MKEEEIGNGIYKRCGSYTKTRKGQRQKKRKEKKKKKKKMKKKKAKRVSIVACETNTMCTPYRPIRLSGRNDDDEGDI